MSLVKAKLLLKTVLLKLSLQLREETTDYVPNLPPVDGCRVAAYEDAAEREDDRRCEGGKGPVALDSGQYLSDDPK